MENDPPPLKVTLNSGEDGFRYERLIQSHLSIKCALRSDLRDFQLALNVHGFEKLDDIVISLVFRDGRKEILLCQLKHKTNGGVVEQFRNLDKYKMSYEKIRSKYSPDYKLTAVLFTNCPKKYPTDVDPHLKVFPSSHILSIFNTNGAKGESYKLEKRNDASSFYDNCYLFCKQVNVVDGDKLISNDSDGCLKSESINEYFLKNMQTWQNPFTKAEVTFMLCDILADSFDFPNDDLRNVPSSKPLIDTLNQFDLCKISDGNARYVTKSVVDFLEIKLKRRLLELRWDEELCGRIDELKGAVEIAMYVNLKIACKKLTKKDLWLFYWAIGELPLLLKITQSNYKHCKFLLQYLSCGVSLVLSDEENLIGNVGDGNLKVFRNLVDLRHHEALLQGILERTHVGLYFNQTSLKEFVDDGVTMNDLVLQTINPDGLIDLLCKNINISTIYEKLSFYIQRQFQVKLYTKNVVHHPGFISIVDNDSIVVNGSIVNTDSIVGTDSIVNTDSTAHNDSSLPQLNDYYGASPAKVYYSAKSPESTAALALEKINKPFCCFQTFGDKYYCYSSNLGNLELIEKYSMDDLITEQTLLEHQSGGKIIYGTAGIGKTTFLQNLAAASSSKHFYIYIHIEDLEKIDESTFTTKEALVDYLSDIMNGLQKNHLKPFIKVLLHTSLERNQLHLLFDGFDETNAKPEIFHGLLNELKIPFILCTRSSKIIELKDVLKTSSMFSMMEFNKRDQEEFIRRNCGSDLDPQTIIDKILKKLSKTESLNFFGNPFLVKLLTNIYRDIEEDVQHWNLISILDKFIEKQMSGYQRQTIIRGVRKMACSLFFDDDLLKQLNIFRKELSEDLTDFHNLNKNDPIISNVNATGELQFTHRIYAEFLCAQYLSQLIVDNKPKEYSGIFELLFAENLIQIRYFFDLLLCRGKPLLNAALLNDYEKVHDILENDKECLSECDQLGRTVGHLIMGYGERYNYPYKVDGLKNIRKSTTFNVFTIYKQFSISTKIFFNKLNFLIFKATYKQDLFDNYPYIYGFYSRSYEFLDIYCHSQSLLSIPDINQTIFFMYLVIHYSFFEIFQNCLRMDFFKSMQWEMDSGKKDDIVLFFNKFNTSIEHFNIEMINQIIINDNYTILHLATKKDLKEIIETILSNNLVPINCLDHDRNTALDYALLNNSKRATNLLIQKGGTTKTKLPNANALQNNYFRYPECFENTRTHEPPKNNQDYLKYPECLQVASLNELLENGKIDINTSEETSSPIYKAVVDSDLDSLQLLIKHGANLNTTYSYDTTLLKVAAQYSTTHIFDFLIEYFGRNNIAMHKLLYHTLETKNVGNAKHLLLTYGQELGNPIPDETYTLMRLAAQVGDSQLLDLLIERGSAIDYLDVHKETPIFGAIKAKNITTLRYLIEQGANLHHKANNNYGVVHAAARWGNSEIIDVLLEAGADIEQLDKNKETPLFYAIKGKNADTFMCLLNCNANFYHKLDNNFGVVHGAAQFLNSTIVGLLYDEGGNIEDLGENQETPIYYAIRSRNMDTLSYLIGCNVNLRHRASNDLSVMHQAAQFGNAQIIDVLIEEGCRIEDLDGNRETPIFYSTRGKNKDALQCLLNRGANVHHKTNIGLSVMHAAAAMGMRDVFQILREAGGNIEDLDANQQTPIFHVKGDNFYSLSTLEYLIECGVNLKHRVQRGLGVLHKMVQYGHEDSIRTLIDGGCDIEDLDDDGRTPIFSAIEHQNLRALKYLVAEGANLNHKSREETVLQFARGVGNQEIIGILLKHGAINE